MLPAQLLSVLYHPLCLPLSYPPLRQAQGRLFAKYAKNAAPAKLWWLRQFEGRATRPTLAANRKITTAR
jgi:hypothetical protein